MGTWLGDTKLVTKYQAGIELHSQHHKGKWRFSGEQVNQGVFTLSFSMRSLLLFLNQKPGIEIRMLLISQYLFPVISSTPDYKQDKRNNKTKPKLTPKQTLGFKQNTHKIKLKTTPGILLVTFFQKSILRNNYSYYAHCRKCNCWKHRHP